MQRSNGNFIFHNDVEILVQFYLDNKEVIQGKHSNPANNDAAKKRPTAQIKQKIQDVRGWAREAAKRIRAMNQTGGGRFKDTKYSELRELLIEAVRSEDGIQGIPSATEYPIVPTVLSEESTSRQLHRERSMEDEDSQEKPSTMKESGLKTPVINRYVFRMAAKVPYSPTVVLDVEGILFKTRISTLTSVKSSYFDQIFSKNWQKELDRHGHLFIDRDSTVFPTILNYLRDGTPTLPEDEYLLAKILQEAKFFQLHSLCEIIERKMSYDILPIKPNSTKKANDKKVMDKETEEKNNEPRPPTNRPANIVPPLSDYSRRISFEEIAIPIKKSTKSTKKLQKSASISLPRNFTHVAHVGWNGSGIIFEKHLLGDEDTVRAIINAAGETEFTPVYNVVSGDSESYASHSVEVVLAGPHMHTKERDAYSQPQRRPPKQNAPKPPMKPKTAVIL